jgi:putative nucleotidyltransferase with HDIG domain
MKRKDFDRILLSFSVKSDLQDLLIDGDLQRTFPEVHAMVGFGGGDQGHKDLWDHTLRVVEQAQKEGSSNEEVLLLVWSALFHDIGKVQCFRRIEGTVTFHNHETVSARLFKQITKRVPFFTTKEVETISFVLENLGYVEAYEGSWTDSAVRRLYKALGEHFDLIISLSKADTTTRNEAKKMALKAKLESLRSRAKALVKADAITPMLPTGLGNAISSTFGIPPSREIGVLMETLKGAVSDGILSWPPTTKEALDYLRVTKPELNKKK